MSKKSIKWLVNCEHISHPISDHFRLEVLGDLAKYAQEIFEILITSVVNILAY